MSCDHVERLHEGFLRDLPIHPQNLGDVHAGVTVLQRPALEERRQFAKVFLERFAVRIRIYEDEAAPGADPNLREPERVRLDLREVPRTRHALELSGKRPAKTVERALQLADPASAVTQGAAAMQARVDVRLDAVTTGYGANQQDRRVADVIHLGVADFRQDLLAAGELPHARPEPLLLELVELPGQIALDRDVGLAEIDGLVASHGRRYGLAVAIQQVLV